MKRKQLIRLKFKDAVLKRDKNKCVFCEETKNLDAHHITDRNLMPNGGYVKENGITLCQTHHLMAEKYHITNGLEWEENMHPDELYLKINSSYALAYKMSEKCT